MSFAPAISDADLARMLGLASPAPPVPDGLAGRIMAALPADVPALPVTAAPRRAARRWLRPGMAIGASLVLASAVAASLADAPLLRQVMERIGLAEPVAVPKPAPVRVRPVPAAVPAARPARPVPAAPVQLNARLPDAPVGALPPMAPPPVLAGPAAVAAMPRAVIRPERPAMPAAIRRERPPEILIAPPVVALPATLPVRVPELATIPPAAATGSAQMATEAAIAATGPAQAGGISAEIAPPAATLQALRQARQNGTLTPDQLRQLRALQAARAARAARAPRPGANRP